MEKTLRYFAPILLKHQSHHQNGFRFLNPAHGTKAPVNYVENFLKSKRVIYFGEIHSNSKIIQMQESVLDLLVNEVRSQPELRSKVVVIMEHFAGPEHQRLLDTFMSKKQNVKMPMKCFIESYDRIGEEGHNLIPYSSLLEYARENSDVVEVKAGFIPRHGCMARGGHGLLKVSLGPAMPELSTPCGRPPLKLFRGDSLQGGQTAAVL
jgi:uncharacterized iron-regulated protein